MQYARQQQQRGRVALKLTDRLFLCLFLMCICGVLLLWRYSPSYLSNEGEKVKDERKHLVDRAVYNQGKNAKPYRKMVIGLNSFWKQFERRASLRDGWISRVNRSDVEYRFLLTEEERGKPGMDEEEAKYHDFLFVPMKDLGYSVGFGLKEWFFYQWVVHTFETDYVLKIDEDAFLCYDRLRQVRRDSNTLSR